MPAADSPTILLVNAEPCTRNRYENQLGRDVRVVLPSEHTNLPPSQQHAVDVVLLYASHVEDQQLEHVKRVMGNNPACRLIATAPTEPDLGAITNEIDEFLAQPVDQEDIQTVVGVLLARSAYERQIQKYYSAAERIASLEVTHSQEELQGNQEFQAATARIQELQEALDRLTDRIQAHRDTAVLFHDLYRGMA